MLCVKEFLCHHTRVVPLWGILEYPEACGTRTAERSRVDNPVSRMAWRVVDTAYGEGAELHVGLLTGGIGAGGENRRGSGIDTGVDTGVCPCRGANVKSGSVSLSGSMGLIHEI